MIKHSLLFLVIIFVWPCVAKDSLTLDLLEKGHWRPDLRQEYLKDHSLKEVDKPILEEQEKQEELPSKDPFDFVPTKRLLFKKEYSLKGYLYPNKQDIRFLLIKCEFANENVLNDTQTVIKDLTSKAEYGGAFTQYLYKVKLSPQSALHENARKLIIKGVYNHQTPDAEAKSLDYLRQQPDIIRFHHASNPHFPILSLDVRNFWYIDPKKHQAKYFSIIKKLPGKAFYEFSKSEMPHIYKKIGRALGEMHYHLATPESKEELNVFNFNGYTTTAHHDFHGKNIFYLPKIDRVAFIDLETMAQAHHDKVPYWHDILFFYLREKYLDDNQRDFAILNKWMGYFIEGYIQAYPLQIGRSLKIDIIYRMRSWSNIFKKVISSKLPSIFHFQTSGDSYNPVTFSHFIKNELIRHKELTPEYISRTLKDQFTDQSPQVDTKL